MGATRTATRTATATTTTSITRSTTSSTTTKAATRTATTTTLTITTTPSPTLSPQTRLIGVGCCRGLQKGILNGWKKGILMSWKNRTWADCAQSCAEHPACNAFAASGCASSSDTVCGGGCHIYETKTATGDIHTAACYETYGFSDITSSTFCYAMP